METTTTIVGAHVLALDEAGTEAEAVAFSGSRIIAVGSREQVLAESGEQVDVVDAGGATVLPGFIDAHHHVSVSVLYGGLLRLTQPGVHDVSSLQAALAEGARDLPPGRWLAAMEWDETRLAERRPPTLAELDEAVPDRPLFALHHTCHRALANSRALELAGIDRDTPEPSGGAISRGRGRVPDGLLIERGMSRVEKLARADLAAHDVEGYLERMAAHYRALVEVGITRVADTAAPMDLYSLYRESARRGEVLVPTVICPVSTTGYLEEPWDVLDGPVTGEQEGPLTIGPVKLVFDGAPGCSMCLSWFQTLGSMARTCALALRTGSLDPIRTSFSISPRMGTKVRSGIAIYQPAEAEAVVGALTERGFGVATHAIGNQAIAVALGAYEATGPRLHDAGIPRIEHAAFLDRKLVARIAEAGVAIVAQPAMLAMHMYASAVSIPGLPFFPLRWLLDAGVLVAGSSDFPVDGFDPLDGIRSAVSRLGSRGDVIEADQRITLDEALVMYTRSAAAACGSLDLCGTLEPGKRADLVVLDGSLSDPESARVRATVIGGRVLHGSIQAPGAA